MFSIISGALNSAVSRFITFEMGKGEGARLNAVYSTAVTIQMILAAVVVLVAEPVGLWFIENEMTIDPSRIPAAKWVLHFSILAFVINLMSVPQMASITAHEKMSAYAVIGIMEGLLRFGVALLIMNSSYDRLIFYAALMMLAVLLVLPFATAVSMSRSRVDSSFMSLLGVCVASSNALFSFCAMRCALS